MGQSAQEKTVYILLTRSGTYFSRLIHFATADSYTHVSIGLDGPIGNFYSFARKYPQLALPAGLVQEQVRWGFFSLHPGMPCCLYELNVSEEIYERLRMRLDEMYRRREEYAYNLLGALSCYFQLPLARRRHYFCSQFVADLLQDSGALMLSKAPSLVRPSDFCNCAALHAIHKGEIGGLPLCVVAG